MYWGWWHLVDGKYLPWSSWIWGLGCVYFGVGSWLLLWRRLG